jgi:hypothetical protein
MLLLPRPGDPANQGLSGPSFGRLVGLDKPMHAQCHSGHL